MQSANIPAMFLATESGSAESIHKSKENEEKGYLAMLDASGDFLYNGNLSQIKCRGNYSFTLSKKPYQIKLDKACDLCGKCMPVCEPKALRVVSDPRQVRMGLAVLDPATCWAHQGSVCDLCYQRCPYPDAAIKMVDGKPQIVPADCTGCGQCAYVCVSMPVSIKIDPKN
jgi:NAD-dependent dihydropyrimidine dehydrogenase PreA subunit